MCRELMGMFAFRFTLLLCSLTIHKSLHAASVLDNSSDLRNWLLNENEEVPSQQSPPLSRRITPKSVFIAPIFNKCPPGTRLDTMNVCVKIVRIDEEANAAAKLESLLSKLNAAFSSANSNPFKVDTGQNESTSTPSSKAPVPAPAPLSTTTEADSEVPSSTLYAVKDSEQISSTTVVAESAEDISGPFQLTIPFSSKNSSENVDSDDTPLILRSNFTYNTNESDALTTTTAPSSAAETEDSSEFIIDAFSPEGTTTSPQFEITFSTAYPDTNTAENQSDVDFSTEVVAESTTTSDTFNTESTRIPVSPKRYYVHSIHQQHVYPSNTERPEFPNLPRLVATPVPSIIYSYTSADVLKTPVRFPQSTRRNESATDDIGTLNQVREYQRLNNNSNRDSAPYGGAHSKNNDSDISDSTISNKLILSSSSNSNSNSDSSSKNDLYQKLPPSSNRRTRPKCDPANGYGDCAPPSKFSTVTGLDKASYSMNVNHAVAAAPPVTTIIRFPGMYTKGASTVVRFPTSNGNGLISGGGHDEQQKPMGVADDPIAFPDVDVGAASRYWESSRYPTSYWNPWDASKSHFVRIWPNNGAAAPTYNVGGDDVNYGFRSQAHDYA